MSSSYESAPQSQASKRDTAAADDKAAEKPAPGEKPREVWRDIDVEISGPVVTAIEKLFRAHWNEQHGPSLDERGEPARLES